MVVPLIKFVPVTVSKNAELPTNFTDVGVKLVAVGS